MMSRGLEIKISTLDIASKRGDDWGKKIVNRITNVLDLVAVEAKYHGDCHKKFFTLPKQGTKRGRPASEELNIAMEKIYNIFISSAFCQYVFDNADHHTNTLARWFKYISFYVWYTLYYTKTVCEIEWSDKSIKINYTIK